MWASVFYTSFNPRCVVVVVGSMTLDLKCAICSRKGRSKLVMLVGYLERRDVLSLQAQQLPEIERWRSVIQTSGICYKISAPALQVVFCMYTCT